MCVAGIGDIGQYLLGPERPSDWVQTVQVSLSPLGSLLTLGHGDRLVICQAKYSGGAKQFTPVYQVRSPSIMRPNINQVITEPGQCLGDRV